MNFKTCMLKTFLLLSIPLFFSACAIYESDFDCPPDIGVPCTSSSDIESMIIEMEKGPDIFVGYDLSYETTLTSSPRKIWVCTYQTKDGQRVEGHYQKDLDQTSCSENWNTEE